MTLKTIKIHNIPKSVKLSITHLSQNLGHDYVNEFIREEINHIINSNEPIVHDINQKLFTDVDIKQEDMDGIEIRNIPEVKLNKLKEVAKKLGYMNVSEFLRTELYKKCSTYPSYMLKKDKNFKHIDDIK